MNIFFYYNNKIIFFYLRLSGGFGMRQSSDSVCAATYHQVSFFDFFLIYNNFFFVYNNKIIFFYLLDLCFGGFEMGRSGNSVCAMTYRQVSCFDFFFFGFFSFIIIIFYLLDLASQPYLVKRIIWQAFNLCKKERSG
jgi:hypothetical protein